MPAQSNAYRNRHGASMVPSSQSPFNGPSTTQAHPKFPTNWQPVGIKYRPSSDQAPTKLRPSSDQVQIIIQSMTEDYMALNDIMAKMGIKHRPTFRENYLNPALVEGAVERLYPEQPKHPKQKYHLTEAAKEWKNTKIPKEPKNSPTK